MTTRRAFLSVEKLNERLAEYANTKATSTFVEMLLDIERHVLDMHGHHHQRAEIIAVTRAWLKAFRPLPDPVQAIAMCRQFERAEKKWLTVREVWGWLAAVAERADVQGTTSDIATTTSPTQG